MLWRKYILPDPDPANAVVDVRRLYINHEDVCKFETMGGRKTTAVGTCFLTLKSYGFTVSVEKQVWTQGSESLRTDFSDMVEKLNDVGLDKQEVITVEVYR